MTFANNLNGYRIILSVVAQKELKKINKQDAVAIENKLKALVSGEQNVDVKKLVAMQHPTYRLRVGCYRILYEVYDREIVVKVIRVVHRKDAYI